MNEHLRTAGFSINVQSIAEAARVNQSLKLAELKQTRPSGAIVRAAATAKATIQQEYEDHRQAALTLWKEIDFLYWIKKDPFHYRKIHYNGGLLAVNRILTAFLKPDATSPL